METVATTWRGDQFQVFATFQWLFIFVAVGAILLNPKVKVDNYIVITIMVFGLGSLVIHTAVGAGIGKWGYEAIMSAGKWAWIPVVILLLGGIWSIRRDRKHDERTLAPYVIFGFLGLVFMVTPLGYGAAEAFAYGLKWVLATVFDLVGWDTTADLDKPEFFQ